MSDIALITLYCIADDFIKALAGTEEGRKMLASWNPKRGPRRQLSLSEVLTLNILRFHYHIFDLKAFARLAESALKADFPGLPNYENFLKATNLSLPFTVALLGYLLGLNRHAHCGEGVFFR